MPSSNGGLLPTTITTAGGANPQDEEMPTQENSALLLSSPRLSDISDTSHRTQQLIAESQKPWPATFERSISLLSSPIINANQVDHFTKSPRPGGLSLAAARRGREAYTPEGRVIPPGRPPNDLLKTADAVGLAKTHSLDFGKHYGTDQQPLQPLDDAQRQQEIKAMQAKEYRKKLLAKQGGGKKDDDFDAKATTMQCVFNMANILMGVGLLGLPFMLRASGWYGGIATLLMFGFVTWRTSVLIGRELNGDPRPSSFFDDSPFKTPLPPGSSANARMRAPIKSFPDIARAAFGETGCFVLSVVLYFELFSCVCIFFVTIGDHMHSLYPAISTSNHIVMACVVSLVPTVLLRTPALLSYFSMVGTLATVAVVSSVVAASFAEGDIVDDISQKRHLGDVHPHHIPFRAAGLPLALGLVAYCFSGHAIVPSIYTTMKKPQEFERMIDYSYLIVVGSCLAVAVSGYRMFGAVVSDQVTISLEQNSSAKFAMTILSWLMVVTAYSKITLTIFPLTLGVEEIIAPFLSTELGVDIISGIIKLMITMLALVVSIFVPSFSFICALVGLICTISVSVIFPAAAHVKLFYSKLAWWEIILDWLFVIVGVISAIIGTVATVRDYN